ncbi:MAG: AbrB/MazE/SpoVT family DNA-binding domain-containing protein [Deltaproteobacteria bacterium]|nr:AbrB/MazE/SpoVT family DNA-binding domain-containing protein [Deltaproteobacteria bacterium]
MEKTRLSNKGQIVIPKAIRELHGWKSGLEFVIENTGDGIKLRPIKPYKQTRIDEAIGCVGYEGPRKSLKDMESAIAKGAKESR